MTLDPLSVALAATAYVAGAVPSGYLIAKKMKGIDIREHGSGNPGAANVYRIAGTTAGLWTLGIDAFKGFLPVLAARHMRPDDLELALLCGALAIVGHVWTVFLVFKGGKGVATSAGVFSALLPGPMVPTLLVFIFGVARSGHISVGSMCAAAALPIFAALFRPPLPLMLLACAASALVLLRHIPNLLSLLRGERLAARKAVR
ncbi:MAG: glycerol-3-phosphate 1-O-acyltransferase PlsY [Elusimicrobiota bacterium]|jgi:glycerol-3-phosphate acyltransferase PlsY